MLYKSKLIKRLGGFFVLFNALLFSFSVCATKLTIVTEHLAPFQIVDGDDVGGFSTEIIEAVLKTSGYEYVIEAHPWSLSFYRATQIANTCIYSVVYIPTRKEMFNWVGSIAKSHVSFYSLASNPIEVSRLDDAKKYNIAVIRDDATHHFLLSEGFVENENFYVMDNYDLLLKLLDTPSRNIDLVVLNNDLLRYRTGTTAKYKSVYAPDNMAVDLYFACSLQTKQSVVDDLKEAMLSLEEQGILLNIRNKWQKNLGDLL